MDGHVEGRRTVPLEISITYSKANKLDILSTATGFEKIAEKGVELNI